MAQLLKVNDNMLFAEISDAIWLALITAILAPIVNMVVGILSTRRMEANIQKIETATNSMKDVLVAKTEKEAKLRGGVEERARADQALVDAKEIAATLNDSLEKREDNENQLSENMDIVKEDVKEVKEDVKDVKSKVLHDVKDTKSGK